MDVATAFLNAILDDVIYIQPPPGYEELVKLVEFICRQ